MEGVFFIEKVPLFIPDCQLVPMSIVDSGWNIDDFGAVGKRVYQLQTLAFAAQLQGNVLLSGITGIQTEQNPLKNNVSLQTALSGRRTATTKWSYCRGHFGHRNHQ